MTFDATQEMRHDIVPPRPALVSVNSGTHDNLDFLFPGQAGVQPLPLIDDILGGSSEAPIILAHDQPSGTRLHQMGYRATWISYVETDVTSVELDRLADQDIILMPRNNESSFVSCNVITDALKKAGVKSIRVWEPDRKNPDHVSGFSPTDIPMDSSLQVELLKLFTKPATYKLQKSWADFGIDRFSAKPDPIQFLFSSPDGTDEGGLLVAKGLIATAGPPGVGKTHTTILEAILCAAWDGKGAAPTVGNSRLQRHGISLVISWEEDEQSLHHIVHQICEQYGLNPAVIGNRMILRSMVGVDSNTQFLAFDPASGTPSPTKGYYDFIDQMKAMAKARDEEIVYIGIDHIGHVCPGADANSYNVINPILSAFGNLADALNCVVNILMHTNKSGADLDDSSSRNTVANGVMGSIANVGGVRQLRMFFRVPEDRQLQMKEALKDDYDHNRNQNRYIYQWIVKDNRPGTYQGRRTLQRKDGRLFDVTDQIRAGNAKQFNALLSVVSDWICKCWAAGKPVMKSGAYAAHRDELRTSRPKEIAKASQKQIMSLLDEALAANMIAASPDHPAVEARPGSRQFFVPVNPDRADHEPLKGEILEVAERASMNGSPMTVNNFHEFRAMFASDVNQAHLNLALQDLIMTKYLVQSQLHGDAEQIHSQDRDDWALTPSLYPGE
jgi:hypothetical protein